MASCLGFCRRQTRDEAQEPLLPQYHDDTVLQARLHQKLHSYQMLRALSKGFMPSTEQLLIQLRTLLASDVLNPEASTLSDSGRLLTKYTKQCIKSFIELLQHKNGQDQLQEFIWLFTHARLSVDTRDLSQRVSTVQATANAEAAFRSIQTVGSLLLTNSEFRHFLSDLQIVGREVFKDSAMATSRVAQDVGNEIDPKPSGDVVESSDTAGNGLPSQDDLVTGAKDFSSTVADGAARISNETQQSLKEHLSGQERKTLAKRLHSAVVKLRQRPDYSEASSTLAILLKKYAFAYSKVLEDTVEVTKQDVKTNDEAEAAIHNFWSLLSSFGDPSEWHALQNLVESFIQNHRRSPDFENLVDKIASNVETALTDPDYFADGDSQLSQLGDLYKRVGNESSIAEEGQAILNQIQRTYQSALADEDIAKILSISMRIFETLSPGVSAVNNELLQDMINVFGPLLIQAIQYVPIPRLEISVPEIDLLLENLIIEPGKTVNNTSFLPFRLKAETYNDLEIRKAHTRITSKIVSLLTIKVDGLSLRADDIGYWLRAHSGLLRLADEGIASFRLDERGIDIHLDVEIGQDRLEKVLTLKAVRVHIHKLSYVLQQSKFSFLAWLLKPLIRPIIRKVMEKQIATAVADIIHAGNRELVYARERLRATRIADPQDLTTFFKAVLTRLTPEPDPDLFTRIGIAQPGEGVFKGVYAPGSIVKLWNEQAAQAPEVIEDFDRGGWRNDIFDVTTRVPD
ncbi:MAG: hypothetical protein M1828_006840 [Chrysothrix sp. TS-e1954]|nr:MAG: hypothetical protein M1828_006840 [Chrysothrix sp. TS-e1954]